MKKIKLVPGVCIVLLLVQIVNGYDITPPANVHQYLTNESRDVWPLIGYDLENHLINPIGRVTNDNDYNSGDDAIDGSREEDLPLRAFRYLRHFWNPDTPNSLSMSGNDDYNNGLYSFDSSYRTALDYWTNKMIPAYIKGDINESYYWLGRVAHLLEDASQPSHVHLDPHAGGSDSSILEDYTGVNLGTLRNTRNWSGENFNQYNYENLIGGFDWSTVQPTRSPDNLNPELFRLFWYTAQKTQYWASDDDNGNIIYRDLNNNIRNWQCSGSGSLNLWADQGYTSCSNFINLSSNLNSTSVDREANATIPHAMRAVAGLYRLFDDAVRIDWPTENHDFRRTGFTLLKGDMNRAQDLENMSFVLEPIGIGAQEQVVKAIVADIDGNGKMETVSFVHKLAAVITNDGEYNRNLRGGVL